MKSAEERAGQFIASFMAKRVITPADRIKACESLVLALKEQDKITRHACAEAVTVLRSEMGEGGDPFTAAHAACMNVKAV